MFFKRKWKFAGNKVQLYGIGFGAGGGTGGIPQDAIGQLNALRFTAVKTMESLVPVMTSLVPSPNSFRVNPVTSLIKTCFGKGNALGKFRGPAKMF